MCVSKRCTRNEHDVPLHKNAGLYGMDDATEPWFLLRASAYHAHLPGEGGGQPVAHLHGHRVSLDIAELVLRVQQASAKEGPGPFNNANVVNEKWMKANRQTLAS